MFHVKHTRLSVGGISVALTDDDIIWLWANTFPGYRSPGLCTAYVELRMRQQQALAADGESKEALVRAQGEAWDLERRNKYLERNRNRSRDDYRVEYGRYHAG